MVASGFIRRAGKDDLDALVAIEQTCFEPPCCYSRRQFQVLLTSQRSLCLVEETEGHLHGFIMLRFPPHSTIAHLETLDVGNAWRGRGVARRLLAAAEEACLERGVTQLQLEVSTGNSSALAVYKKVGYQHKEIIPDYYIHLHHGTRDVYRMVKDLQ